MNRTNAKRKKKKNPLFYPSTPLYCIAVAVTVLFLQWFSFYLTFYLIVSPIFFFFKFYLFNFLVIVIVANTISDNVTQSIQNNQLLTVTGY